MHPTSINPADQSPTDLAQLKPEASSDIIWHSPVGIFTSTPGGRYTFANPAAARIYGYNSPAELIASITDISSQIYAYPADREKFQRQLQEQGELTNHEYQHLRRDGSVFWVSLSARAIYDEHGTLTFYHGFCADITERKTAARFIESRERYLQKILETSEDGFWVINDKGLLQEVNQTYCAMSGYFREELLGLAIADLEASETPGETLARINRIKTHGAEVFETFHRRKDGTLYPVEISVTWLDQDGGQMVCFCRDITERKKADEIKVRHQEELDEINRIGRVAGSTLELEEVLKHILENVTKSVNASVGMIFLTDLAKENIVWGASLGLSEQFVNDFIEIPIRIGEGLTGTIVQTGESIFIQENSSNDPRIVRQVIVKENFNSFLGVPIYADDKVVGVMNILTRPPLQLKERDKHFCAAVGSQVGLAIINAKNILHCKISKKRCGRVRLFFGGCSTITVL
jgi:PAS domain S-box-containing protein